MENNSENLQMDLVQENPDLAVPSPAKAKKLLSKKALKWLLSGIAALLVLCILLPILSVFVVTPLKLSCAKELIGASQYKYAYYLLKQCESDKEAQALLEKFEVSYGYQKASVYKEDGSLYRTIISNCNSDGNVTSEIAYDGKAETVYTREYKYDQYGNLVAEVYSNGKHTRTNTIEYVYGENGNILEMITYRPDDEHTRVSHSKYDDRGNLIEMSDYYPEGSLIVKYTYVYDQNNNCILDLRESGNPRNGSARTESVYDAGNRILKETTYHNDEYISHREYTYTPSGKIKSNALFKDNGLSSKREYTYDSQDHLIQVYSSSVNGKFKTIYKYDSAGNRVQVERYTNNTLESKHIYKYDLRGNLLHLDSCNTDGSTTKVQRNIYNLWGKKTKEIHFNNSGEEFEKTEYRYGLLGSVYKQREYANGELKKEYKYDIWGNMTEMYSNSYFDEYAIYGIQEVGKLNIEYSDPIIHYKSED